MRALWNRITWNKSGWCMSLVAVLLVIGWRLIAISHRPSQWREIASELGSLPTLREEVNPNHGNTAIVFTRDTENGRGWYYCSRATGKVRLIWESDLEGGGKAGDFYGWSPDDSRFAYGRPLSSKEDDWELVICDGKTGEVITRLKHPHFQGPDSIVWLSPQSFGCLTWSGAGRDFGVIEQQPDGTWLRGKFWPHVSPNAPFFFTAVSGSSVAWAEKLGGVDFADDNSTNLQWTISAVGDNHYRITAANGLALTAVERHSPLALRPYDGGPLQLWRFKANGANFNIGNVGNGQNLDANWGGARTIVYQWDEDTNNVNQAWSVIRVDGTPIRPTEAIPDGSYRITCPAGGNSILSYSDTETRIQLLDIASGTIKTLWRSFTNHPSEVAYSKGSGTFLLNCSSENRNSLIRLNRYTGITTEEPLTTAQSCTFRPRSAWTDDSPIFTSQGGSSESVRLSDDGLNTFCIGRDLGSMQQRLPWCGGVTAHCSLNNGHLYVVGYPTNEPPGVWDYDVANGSMDCIVSGLSQPLKRATYVAPSYGLLTNASGATSGYSLWKPAGFSTRKKYPAILCQTVNGEWLPFIETAANLDCYFAMAHRPYWLGRKLQDWPTDVMALYQSLASNPNVDTNRIFLWAHSAESGYLCQLLREKPQLWRGAILFDYGAMPDLESLRGKKLFIVGGVKDDGSAELKKYQERALAAGVTLKLILQENSAHNPVSISTMRERTVDFARCLAEDL